jgi:hypothetical protein
MKTTTENLASTNGTTEYLVITELPSKFRTYDFDKLYVRGLYFSEALALSKFVGNLVAPDYNQLLSIYSDAIKLPSDSKLGINDLELIDFITLMTISSIYSVDDFTWNYSIRCNHLDGKGNSCTGVINEKITLDDLVFSDPKITTLPIPIRLGDNQYLVGPVTINDVISKTNYLNDNPDTSEKLLDYAILIKSKLGSDDHMSFSDKVELISNSLTRELSSLYQIHSEIDIDIEPITKVCPTCNSKNKLYILLNKIRSYP